MKVTSKTMYTLHFLTGLAIKSKDWPSKPIHLREIAKEYNIPFKFLEQIAILMKSVGLVRGARGRIAGGEHEAGGAIGEARLADALRPAQQPGMMHAAAGERRGQFGLGGTVADQQRIFTRGGRVHADAVYGAATSCATGAPR